MLPKYSEDEFGFINLVVWRNIYEKFREILNTSSFLLCEGKIQKSDEGGVTHVIVESAAPLLSNAGVSGISHDYH